jgi:hypothetical protein
MPIQRNCFIRSDYSYLIEQPDGRVQHGVQVGTDFENIDTAMAVLLKREQEGWDAKQRHEAATARLAQAFADARGQDAPTPDRPRASS